MRKSNKFIMLILASMLLFTINSSAQSQTELITTAPRTLEPRQVTSAELSQVDSFVTAQRQLPEDPVLSHATSLEEAEAEGIADYQAEELEYLDALSQHQSFAGVPAQGGIVGIYKLKKATDEEQRTMNIGQRYITPGTEKNDCPDTQSMEHIAAGPENVRHPNSCPIAEKQACSKVKAQAAAALNSKQDSVCPKSCAKIKNKKTGAVCSGRGHPTSKDFACDSSCNDYVKIDADNIKSTDGVIAHADASGVYWVYCDCF